MRSQGIKGPSYKFIIFIHRNTKESFSIKEQSLKYLVGLSHGIFPRIQPHFYSGKNFLTWVGSQPHMLITEPELGKEILIINKVSTQK